MVCLAPSVLHAMPEIEKMLEGITLLATNNITAEKLNVFIDVSEVLGQILPYGSNHFDNCLKKRLYLKTPLGTCLQI